MKKVLLLFLLVLNTHANSTNQVNQEIQERNPWMTQYKLFGGGNPRVNSKGERLVEGDIVIAKEKGNKNDLFGKKAIPDYLALWTEGKVYYDFHKSIYEVPGLDKLIEDAIEHWRNSTCLQFKRKGLFDDVYLNFRHDLDGCYSYIGNNFMIYTGQEISIGIGCEYFHTIVHEIGHAIGFFHEQSRLDRDKYAVLLPDNINPDMQPQFFKYKDRSFGVPYDFHSEMHYGSMGFSNRPFEKNTLVTKNPHNQRLMGKYIGLTFRDRKIANFLYNCGVKCSNKDAVTCQNQGYLKTIRDQPQNCFCDCPPRTSGQFCENVEGDYYEDPICGGNVTEPGVIQTPNYPERKNPYEDCSWWIQAPPGQRVEVTFLDFLFDPRLNLTGHPLDNLCVFERVEIRTEDRYNGDMYCGQDIPKGFVKTSKDNEFIILISASKYKTGRGLKANVKFV